MTGQRKSNIIAVLVAAYSSSLAIEFSGLPIEHIFWSYCLLYFCVIVYCHEKCLALKGYAALNFAMLCACFPLIFADYPLIHIILWDANILTLSDIMLSYELAILTYGGWRAAMAIYNRDYNVDSRGSAGGGHNNQGSKA